MVEPSNSLDISIDREPLRLVITTRISEYNGLVNLKNKCKFSILVVQHLAVLIFLKIDHFNVILTNA